MTFVCQEQFVIDPEHDDNTAVYGWGLCAARAWCEVWQFFEILEPIQVLVWDPKQDSVVVVQTVSNKDVSRF